MAHAKVSKDEVLDHALELFRTSGFEGVSLSDLSAATGLEKPSLYFRFPGGKEEIVLAVLNRVIDFFNENVFGPLLTDDTPRNRVIAAAQGLRTFYADGSKSCVTDVLSLRVGSAEIAKTLTLTMNAWLNAFTAIARESGLTPEQARLRAEDAIVDLEGSLVLSRLLGDAAAFNRVLEALPDLLTKQ
jgi:TetR/AcrR family transcriptional regulator, lmrAB and yxaGH operons repressor